MIKSEQSKIIVIQCHYKKTSTAADTSVAPRVVACGIEVIPYAPFTPIQNRQRKSRRSCCLCPLAPHRSQKSGSRASQIWRSPYLCTPATKNSLEAGLLTAKKDNKEADIDSFNAATILRCYTLLRFHAAATLSRCYPQFYAQFYAATLRRFHAAIRCYAQFYDATFPRCSTLLHCNASAMLLRFFSVMLPRCYVSTLLRFYAATLLRCATASCYAATPLRRYAVTLLHCFPSISCYASSTPLRF